MKLNRLVRKLRREVQANPKKAAFLGVIVLVALYFWVPLAWGWTAKSCPAAGAKAANAAADVLPAGPTGLASPSGAKSKETDTPQYPWQQLVEWIENDPRSSPANAMPEARDPFRIPEAQTPKKEEKPALVQKPLTPETLGMVLSGTMVGPGRRVAVINGKTYEEGRTIELSSEGQTVAFTVVQIHARQVILQRNAERFELNLRVPPRSGRVELVGGKS